MRNKFDNFLLTFLWLTITTLVSCFWFNIKFGFNIFAQADWNYLAYMQATQQSINPLFYISLIISVFIAIFGLYMLIRPRRRKIKLKNDQNETPEIATSDASHAPNIFAHVYERPKRLNTQHILSVPTTPTNSAVQTVLPPNIPLTAPTEPVQKWDKKEIASIFESAGYTTKPTPKIQGLQTILFAIGTNETLWIGAADCEPAQLQKRIETIQQVFADTLEDIEIKINAFVLNSVPLQSTPEILTFDKVETLREYITAHPNEPLSDEEKENFEAFSGYISTVIEYLGRI